MVFLLYTFTATPYTIAFLNDPSWILVAIDFFVDFVFLIDIVINFFIAYYDSNYKLVDNKKKIAWKYLTTWFVVDFFSILPFNLINNSGDNYSSLG